MKIILLQDIQKLGQAGDIKEVADGYARNFLFPKGLAEIATKSAVKKALALQQKKKQEEEKLINKAKDLAKVLEKVIITIKAKSAPDGKLFGSVTEKDIVKAVKDQIEKNLEEKSVQLKEPIKKIGEYSLKVKLHKEVEADLKIKVIGVK